MARKEMEEWKRRWGLEHDEYEIEGAKAVVWHYSIWVAVFVYSVLGGPSCGA